MLGTHKPIVEAEILYTQNCLLASWDNIWGELCWSNLSFYVNEFTWLITYRPKHG